ncbi:MAG: hypothetical protein Q4C48_11555 [Lachnospiraceae bacterium]|nr:hypothetical protein [Lachnospiraceae bacterium]
MKLRYRIVILCLVFIAALIYFYRKVPEHTYLAEQTTVSASAATLPVVSFCVDGAEMNQTLGYTFLPEEALLRQSITPIMSDLSFQVLIDQKESVVKRLTCTVMEVSGGTLVEETEIMALKEWEDGRLYAPIMLTGTYARDVEYTLRITLTTNEGRNIYYYTRLLVTKDTSVAQKLAFSQLFHDSVLDYDAKFDMEKYLENTSADSGLDYAAVTLSDSIDVVGYGDMNPTEIACGVPTVTEYNEKYLSVTLDFWLEIVTGDARENVSGREEYRYFSEGSKNILYNYSRTLNARFDGTLVSINKNQIKVGLTTDTELNYLLSENEKYLLFVRDGALWQFDMNTNTMVRVFGFYREGMDYARYDNREHDFKLISVDDKGNADFVFYGYITRGEYEGRVGILYYRYHAEERRLEEMMFVPVTVPYEILKEEFGAFVYMNEYDEFYFTLYDTLYLYRTLVNDFSVVSEHLSDEWVHFPEQELLVYQETEDNASNTSLVFYDLENRAATRKDAPEGERILLLGTIDNRIVYGLAKEEDLTFYEDGSDCVPMYRLVIEEPSGEIVKNYSSGTQYIASAQVEGNVISIKLCKKTGTVPVTSVDADGTERSWERPLYEEAGDDIILNIKENATERITLSTRTTDLMHKEYYLNLPSGFKLEKIPKSADTVFTVITDSTTVRVGGWLAPRYYVEAYGRVALVSESLGECIALADQELGTVYDSRGTVVWMRGAKANSASLSNFSKTYASGVLSAEQAVLQMFFDYKGMSVDAGSCNLNERAFLAWLEETIPGTAVSLSGVSLNQVLAFVSDGKPVAVRSGDSMFVIIGYSSTLLTYVDPAQGKTYTKELTKMNEQFDKEAVYYSYID